MGLQLLLPLLTAGEPEPIGTWTQRLARFPSFFGANQWLTSRSGGRIFIFVGGNFVNEIRFGNLWLSFSGTIVAVSASTRSEAIYQGFNGATQFNFVGSRDLFRTLTGTTLEIYTEDPS